MNLRKLLGLCSHEFGGAQTFNIKDDETNIIRAIIVMGHFHFPADEEEQAVVEAAGPAGGRAWEARTASPLLTKKEK